MIGNSSFEVAIEQGIVYLGNESIWKENLISVLLNADECC